MSSSPTSLYGISKLYLPFQSKLSANSSASSRLLHTVSIETIGNISFPKSGYSSIFRKRQIK